MVNFIKELRTYFENRYPGQVVPDAPFSIATFAVGGFGQGTNAQRVAQAQLNVSGEAGNYMDFEGNVKTMEARAYWRTSAASPSTDGVHYNHNAETYMLVGDALGRGIVEMLEGGTTPPPPVEGAFGEWADSFAALTDPDPTLDFDGGGLATALEWVLGGDPTDASDDMTILPTIDTDSDPDGKLVFTFRRNADAAADENTTITVEYGNDLIGWTAAVHQGSGVGDITVTSEPNAIAPGIDRVIVALPATLAGDGKLFARLQVEVTP